MVYQRKSLIEKYKADVEKNALFLALVEQDAYDGYRESGDSAIIRGTKGGYYNCIFAQKRDVKALLEGVKEKIRTLVFVGKHYIEPVKKVLPEMVCQEFIYMVVKNTAGIKQPEDFLTDKAPPGLRVVPLTLEWLDFIDACYHCKEFNRLYLAYCITNDFAYGLEINGERAGYILIHKNMDIGPIFVKPAYRGTNAACLLTATLLKDLRNAHRTPYLIIDPKNKPSIAQAEKCGFSISPHGIVIGYILDKKGHCYQP